MIKLNDTSLLVSYIQIRLKESLFSNAPRTIDGVTTYDLEDGLRVTGSYNRDTYRCASLFMNKLYPNEGFPCKSDSVDPSEYELPENYTVYDLIDENIRLSSIYPEVLDLPDRVIAYFVKSVVSEISPDEEIYDIEKLIYGSAASIPLKVLRGGYPELSECVKNKQALIKDKYGSSSSDREGIDIKVTGYFDPITEAYFDKV